MRTANDRQIAWAATSAYINETATVLTLELDQVYFLNVISYIYTSSGVVPLVYTPIEMTPPGPFSRDKIKLIVIAIATGAIGLLVLAFAAVLIYCWKCRQTSTPLNTEMQENRVSISSEPEAVQNSKRVAMYQSMELPKV